MAYNQLPIFSTNIYILFSQTYYLSAMSVTALKILTENRQRTEPTDLPKPRGWKRHPFQYHPNFPNCDQISPPLLRITIRRNCIKRSRVLEGAENNGNNKRGKKQPYRLWIFFCTLQIAKISTTFFNRNHLKIIITLLIVNNKVNPYMTGGGSATQKRYAQPFQLRETFFNAFFATLECAC